MMKICEDCFIEQDIINYAKSRHTTDGLQRRCKECRKRTRKENALRLRQKGTCIIYLLTNLLNGKVYVGQTWMPIELRMGKDGFNYSNSPYIFNAIKKYGCENFKYTVLETCQTQEIADKLEEQYMMQFNSRNLEIGYNLKEGGSAGKHSEETKIKIAETLQSQFNAMTQEEKNKRAEPISTYCLGKERGPHTEEWKEDNSQFM